MGWIATKNVAIANALNLTIRGEQIKGFFETEADANAEAGGAPGITVREVPDKKLAGVQLDWYWHAGDVFTADGLSESQRTHLERHQYAIERLRRIEAQPVDFWQLAGGEVVTVGDGDDQREVTRAESYGSRARMLSRAINASDNLTDDAKWAILKAELDIDPRTWFWAHELSVWAGYNLDSEFHRSANPNSREDVREPSIELRVVSGGTAKQLQ